MFSSVFLSDTSLSLTVGKLTWSYQNKTVLVTKESQEQEAQPVNGTQDVSVNQAVVFMMENWSGPSENQDDLTPAWT